MPEPRRPVRTLLLVFLLYLAAAPLWWVVQPAALRLTVALTGRLLPLVEYPAVTERLAFAGSTLEIYGAPGGDPVGRWDELRFPFYLPFVTLLVLLFPGVPVRDRFILLGFTLLLLLLLQVTLLFVVVQQVHHQFLAEKGARWLSAGGLRWYSFHRRLLFQFGNQAFSAAAVFFLFLRYGGGLRRNDDAPSPARLGRRAVGTAAAAIAALLLLLLAGALLHRSLLRRSPRYEGIRMALGTLYQRAGRLPEAVASFREAVRANPENSRAHNNLAVALAGQGEWERAGASFRRAIELDPDLAEARKGLGLIQLRLGRPCDAAVSLVAARERMGRSDPELSDEFLQSVRRRCAETP